ncbi:hypothetical protein B0H14DRAFT_3742517 [Mycena olivaceomarginata]|nr:hypothetical protein B0H14DRAFT_3742517 [Mycena olivaceomarginata]
MRWSMIYRASILTAGIVIFRLPTASSHLGLVLSSCWMQGHKALAPPTFDLRAFRTREFSAADLYVHRDQLQGFGASADTVTRPDASADSVGSGCSPTMGALVRNPSPRAGETNEKWKMGGRDELCARRTRADARHSPFFFGLSMLARTPSPPSYCAPLCDGHFLGIPFHWVRSSRGPDMSVSLTRQTPNHFRARTHRFRGEEGERHRLGDASRTTGALVTRRWNANGNGHGSELQERRGTHGIIMVAAYSSAMRVMHILESQGERCETECKRWMPSRLCRASAGLPFHQLAPHPDQSSLERTDSTRSFLSSPTPDASSTRASGGPRKRFFFGTRVGDMGWRELGNVLYARAAALTTSWMSTKALSSQYFANPSSAAMELRFLRWSPGPSTPRSGMRVQHADEVIEHDGHERRTGLAGARVGSTASQAIAGLGCWTSEIRIWVVPWAIHHALPHSPPLHSSLHPRYRRPSYGILSPSVGRLARWSALCCWEPDLRWDGMAWSQGVEGEGGREAYHNDRRLAVLRRTTVVRWRLVMERRKRGEGREQGG